MRPPGRRWGFHSNVLPDPAIVDPFAANVNGGNGEAARQFATWEELSLPSQVRSAISERLSESQSDPLRLRNRRAEVTASY